MTYALIRPAERTDEGTGVLIVALERLDALSKILGKVEIIGKVRGCWIYKSSRRHYAHFSI
jgi:hypothetical protein